MNDRELVLYQFSRDKVERGDFSAFLAKFGEDRLPTGPALAKMMGTLVFMVEGYDHDPRELYAIPEVRRFYTAFHSAWPRWLYFCNLDQRIRLPRIRGDGARHGGSPRFLTSLGAVSYAFLL